jgi:hypothetical protein
MRQNAILKGGAYVHCQMVLKQYDDLNVYSANWRRNNSPQMRISCQRDTLSYLQAIQSLCLLLNASWVLNSNFLLDNSIQHCVIKFVSDLRQIGLYSPCSPVPSTNKTDRHDITEIVLKVEFNTHALPLFLKIVSTGVWPMWSSRDSIETFNI